MLAHFWAWFYANCVGNLVASAIWDLPIIAGFVLHHRNLKAELRKVSARLGHHEEAGQ